MLLNGTTNIPVSQLTCVDITLTCDDEQEENHGYVVVDFTVYDENGNELVDDDFLEDDRNRNRELQPITAPSMKFADVKEAKAWAKSNVVGEYVVVFEKDHKGITCYDFMVNKIEITTLDSVKLPHDTKPWNLKHAKVATG